MDSKKRREDIFLRLTKSNKPIKGIEFASIYNVTRQVIVKDIALLRAEGNKIISTPDGYMVVKKENKFRSLIVVSHDESRMKEELEVIIKYGGSVEDVIIEHPLYGDIRATLMIKNLNDLNKFIYKYNNNKTNLLSLLTNGIHIHTISCDSEENIELIKNELNERGFIVS
ncbi:transcriptional regulator of NAD metabolism [Clostridium moniliforme]|uniref:Transcriptional regulator of NAD metabolism n=1 Tax=Clostridium moniliforme TaxID=39489 RepID=A0ABS4F3S9_9CLOT|nr:transcription repressor NadR [Clostridium moniliforme]MBP1890908.1 transcriptional regulator of NAD metabolism [Clostridium moniliforme]